MCAFGCVLAPIALLVAMLVYKGLDVFLPEQVAAVGGFIAFVGFLALFVATALEQHKQNQNKQQGGTGA